MSKVRVLYSVLSLLGCGLAYHYFPVIVEERTNFNVFSYVGVVATFVGLLVAVCEVIHQLVRSIAVQDESRRLLRSVKNVEYAGTISHCLSIIDDVNGCFERADYHGALKSFRFFRRMVTSLYRGFGLKPDELRNGVRKKIGLLGELEEQLSAATHTSVEAPLSAPQRSKFRSDMLQIKNQIENYMHVDGAGDAS